MRCSHENRRFDPPAQLVAGANAQPDIYDDAGTTLSAFWERTPDRLEWTERWDCVLEREAPYARWFRCGEQER